MKLQRIILFIVIFSSLTIVFNCASKKNINRNTEPKEVNYIPYYLKVYEADSLYLIKDYEKSYAILDSLFQIYEPLNQDIWYELQHYVIMAKKFKQFNKAKKYAKILISNWGYNYNWFEDDLKNQFQFSEKTLDSLKVIYSNQINKKYSDTIAYLNKWDANEVNLLEDEIKRDSLKKVEYKLLLSLIYKYGIPDKRIVGNSRRGKLLDIISILNHIAQLDTNNQLKEVIWEGVKNGELLPDNYAQLVDQPLLKKNETVYGIIRFSEKSDSLKENIRSINNNRRQIGLPSYEYINWREDKLFNNP